MKEYHLCVNGHDYVITLKSLTGDRAEMEVDGENYAVDIHSIHRKGSPKRRPSPTAQRGIRETAAHVPTPPDMGAGTSTSNVTAPIPGVVLEIYVKEGQSVEAGADLLKMEAMKMENRITAPRAGKIARIHVKVGDPVPQSQLLVELQ